MQIIDKIAQICQIQDLVRGFDSFFNIINLNFFTDKK